VFSRTEVREESGSQSSREIVCHTAKVSQVKAAQRLSTALMCGHKERQFQRWAQWFMPVITATWDMETEGSWTEVIPGQKLLVRPYSKNKYGDACL
jgi:hypothetical protein